LLIAVLAVAPLCGANHWVRIASPDVEVLSSAGQNAGRRALARLEQARQVFAQTAPAFNGELPVRVFVFSSEREFNRFRPAPAVAAFYQSGPDRDYIVMLDAGRDAYRVVFHEYAHLVLNHSAPKLPTWLEEGLAELYSTITERDGMLIIGEPILSHLALLQRSRWLDADQLATVGKDSPEYNEREQAGLFYAESWALTHMISLAPGYRGGLPRMVRAIAAGVAPDEAFRSAFGKSMRQALNDVSRYLATGLQVVRMPGPEQEAPEAAAASPVATADVQIAQAELLTVMNHLEAAAELYTEAARAGDSAAAETGLAELALRAKRYSDARTHFERAIALGSRDGSTFFQYAMLLRDTKAPREQVDEYLTKTVEASPGFAEAHFLLGVRASDRGDYHAAIEHLRRAASLLPRQMYFWHALSYAYYKLGQVKESRSAAYRAINAAANPQELQMARAALNLTAEKDAPRDSRPSVITPSGWQNKRGDRKVAGSLAELDCASKPVRLRVRTRSGDVALRVTDPRSVVLSGAGAARVELQCGVQSGRDVVVEYIGSTSEVTSIEFH
jgi:tetratricopeptide (TPR) repeat protein